MIGFAGAKGPMTPGTADGINTTVLVQAGVLTFSIIACKSEVTLGITLAASCEGDKSHEMEFERGKLKTVLTFSTDCEWVANKSSSARACGSVVIDTALCIGAACESCAWILTSLLDAGKVLRTFRVGRAFRPRC